MALIIENNDVYFLKDHTPHMYVLYVCMYVGFPFLYGLTQDEHRELVESTYPFRESVVRIIKAKEEEVIGTGNAFLVYSGHNKSLFLTCDHNFEKNGLDGEVIRLYQGNENYPVAEILRRSEEHDLLLFSVNSVPKRKCMEFSTDKVNKDDKVVILGYVSPTLPVNSEMKQLVLVSEPHSITGVVR